MRNMKMPARAINAAGLHRELAAALPGRFVGVSTAADEITIHLEDGATPEDEGAALAVLDAHDPSAMTAEQQAERDFLAAWRGGALVGKTPADIYRALDARIGGWASLADAKADLREWLPLMGAALIRLLGNGPE